MLLTEPAGQRTVPPPDFHLDHHKQDQGQQSCPVERTPQASPFRPLRCYFMLVITTHFLGMLSVPQEKSQRSDASFADSKKHEGSLRGFKCINGGKALQSDTRRGRDLYAGR